MKSKGQGTNDAASQLGPIFSPLEGIFGLVWFWFLEQRKRKDCLYSVSRGWSKVAAVHLTWTEEHVPSCISGNAMFILRLIGLVVIMKFHQLIHLFSYLSVNISSGGKDVNQQTCWSEFDPQILQLKESTSSAVVLWPPPGHCGHNR